MKKHLNWLNYTNFYQSGSLSVLNSDIKKDSDLTSGVAAYAWIQQINKEKGSSEDFRIDQVIYNQDIDIMELVKKGKTKI
ncbi:hypothetical protein P4502_12520 [Peribacillus frigoritolerans]|uniref:hypothetical protein n=1 Tax=Peribacillus frigoritolerans TaxID=450367 RepID=UPI002E1B3630|nr:hypothetical protein [Peribacillus frigoritolerans]